MSRTKSLKPRFAFSLQRVLDVRQFETKSAEADLIVAREALSRQESLIAESRQRLLHHASDEKITGNKSAQVLRHRSAHHLQARTSISMQEQELDSLKNSEEDNRARLMKARRAEQTLESLRSREKNRHTTEMARHDNVQLDDMAITRFGRNTIL